MIELFIENEKIDLFDNVEIDFTFEPIDTNKLTSIKNNFSKTVKIPATPNNNYVFGQIYRMDKYINVNMVNHICDNFDPHKKTEWFILKNGAIVNSGYCTLDNIIVIGEKNIEYQLTLYGGIGNMFYNLSYNETVEGETNTTNKTLKDIYFSWYPLDDFTQGTGDFYRTLNEENSNVLYNCTPANIAWSYHNLMPKEISSGPTFIYQDIVFVPTYSGQYNEFDSKHMIVSTFNQNQYDNREYIPYEDRLKLKKAFPDNYSETVTVNGETKTNSFYTLNTLLENSGNNKYGLVTFSRDVIPSETSDIRINEMPVAIRLSKLMSALTSKENCGYDVEWDDDIIYSNYWQYGFVMLGKLNQSSEQINLGQIIPPEDYFYNSYYLYASNENNQYYVNARPQPIFYEINFENNNFEKGSYIFKLNYKPKIKINEIQKGSFDYQWGNFKYSFYSSAKLNSNDKYEFVFLPVIVTKIYLDNTLIKQIADAFWIDTDGSYLPSNVINNVFNSVNSKYGINLYNFNVHNCKNIVNTSIENVSETIINVNIEADTELITTDVSLSNDGVIKVESEQVMCYVKIDSDGTNTGIFENDTRLFYDENFSYSSFFQSGMNYTYNLRTPVWTSLTFEVDNNKTNGLLSKYNVGSNIIKLTKDLLFANSTTASKYLIDFCKLMNYKFIFDTTKNRVYIKTFENYYNDTDLNIENFVNEGEKIEIKPVFSKNKIINIGLETPESYPVYLYNKERKDKFNTVKFDTNIEYNSSEEKLFDNSIYKNSIDWQHSSVYNSIIPQFPKAYNTPYISWTLFNKENNTNSLANKNINTEGISALESNLLQTNDFYPKQSMFDANNKLVDVFPNLVFLNGFVKNYDYKLVPQSYKLVPDEIIENAYINSSGEKITSTYQDIWVFKGIENYIDKKLTMSARFSSEYGSYVIYYYGIDSNGNEYFISYEYPQRNQTYNDVPLTIPVDTKIIKMNVRKTEYDFFNITKQAYLETIEPDEILISKRYSTSGAAILNSTIQDVYVYIAPNQNTQIFDTNATYTMSAKGTSETGAYFANYVDLDENLLGYEGIQTNATYEDFVLTIPSQTHKIYLNVVKQYSGLSNIKKRLESQYTISPRIMFSSDTTMQYFLNSQRCYMYDFNYNDLFRYWGIYSTQRKSVATSWALPFFTKDLYNLYNYNEQLWYSINEKAASWNIVNQTGLDNIYELSNTDFIHNTSDNIYTKQTESLIEINSNEYSLDNIPKDIENTRIYDKIWKDYVQEIYNRNAREVTCYVDLSSFSDYNDIMRNIYIWNGNRWIITKIYNYKLSDINNSRYTKVTMHRIVNNSLFK